MCCESVIFGGGHGGRPHPFSIRFQLCFTGVPRMGPSMPLTALRLSIGRIGLQDSSPAAGSYHENKQRIKYNAPVLLKTHLLI